MGIIISTLPGSVPRPIVVELICDEPDSILCVSRQKFQHRDGLIGCRSAAMAAGWLERSGAAWICPACSGKDAR